jgi:hypothetical protein
MENSRHDPLVFYDDKLEDFLKKNPDKDELYFINQNLICYEDLVENNKNDTIIYDENYINYTLKYRNFFRTKKRYYLIEKRLEKPVYLDLSDSKAVDKIIYLSELGILEFLKSKNKLGFSENRLATLLSAITGEKQTTLVSILYRILQKESDDPKHPFYNKDKIIKIKDILKKQGL